METTIYEAYRRRGTSFEMTVGLIQDILSERLVDGYTKIWVQGSPSRLIFTIFDTSGYVMRFLNTGGLRQFRHDGVLGEEITIMERFIEGLRQGVLSDFIE
jgi:hypothetical protein